MIVQLPLANSRSQTCASLGPSVVVRFGRDSWPACVSASSSFTLAPAAKHAQALQVIGGVAKAKAPGNLSFSTVSGVWDAPCNLKGGDAT